MIGRPPTQPVTELELLDYAQRLTLWLTDAYHLLKEYEQRKRVRRTAASMTTGPDDRNIAVTDTTAPRTVTVASASIAKLDFELTVSDESGGAAANNITVVGEGGENINGNPAGTAIAANYGSVRLRSDGTELYIIE